MTDQEGKCVQLIEQRRSGFAAKIEGAARSLDEANREIVELGKVYPDEFATMYAVGTEAGDNLAAATVEIEKLKGLLVASPIAPAKITFGDGTPIGL
tara:strand:- start:161 stop:451 length:291 start_codon:yes stop_codon:yes gene_type:complete